MKKQFTVQVNQQIRRTLNYVVEAESKEEAKALVADGAIEPSRTYETFIDKDIDCFEHVSK